MAISAGERAAYGIDHYLPAKIMLSGEKRKVVTSYTQR
jgi:hypothetical protein